MQQVDSPQTMGVRSPRLRRATATGAQWARQDSRGAGSVLTSTLRMLGIL